ncbi:MAG: lipoyl(octanoyl) transferase LipB [Planctomycetaceae bacterium]|nr:lipoyl(octanoyl) transferase LipB [Planctomycetaceae bacterium]
MQKAQVESVIEVIDGGLMGYAEALALQTDLCLKRQTNEIANTVLIVEHPAVITLGARKSENKLLATPEQLAQAGVTLAQVGRGGGTTAHNPGQVVVYPVLKLKSVQMGVSEYVRALEGIDIELLDGLGVEAERKKGLPGLWVGEKKIASVGVQIKKWVTFHGIALNICNDLSIFKYIVPCGLDGVKMTSVLEETGKRADMAQVKRQLHKLCKEVFGPKAK